MQKPTRAARLAIAFTQAQAAPTALKAALLLVRAHVPVIAVNAKGSAGANGPRHPVTEAADVRALWVQYPDAEVGIVCGREIFALDADGWLGYAALQALAMQERLPEQAFWAQRTPSGGWHILAVSDGYMRSPQILKEEGHNELAVQGDGKIIRLHRSEQPASFDALVQTLVNEPEVGPAHLPAVLPWEAAAGAVRGLQVGTDRILKSTSGSRNSALYAAARYAGGHVATGALTERQVEDALGGAARTVGLEVSEIRSTIASGIRAGRARPHIRRKRTKLDPVVHAQAVLAYAPIALSPCGMQIRRSLLALITIICELATTKKRAKLELSARFLEERTGMGLTANLGHLQRLVALGLLELVEPGSPRLGTGGIYRLAEVPTNAAGANKTPEGSHLSADRVVHFSGKEDPVVPGPAHDVWKALGRPARDVAAAALEHAPGTLIKKKELSKLAGVSVDVVERLTQAGTPERHTLASAGVLARAGRGVLEVGIKPDWNALAEDLGVAGRGEQQKAMRTVERRSSQRERARSAVNGALRGLALKHGDGHVAETHLGDAWTAALRLAVALRERSSSRPVVLGMLGMADRVEKTLAPDLEADLAIVATALAALRAMQQTDKLGVPAADAHGVVIERVAPAVAGSDGVSGAAVEPIERVVEDERLGVQE